MSRRPNRNSTRKSKEEEINPLSIGLSFLAGAAGVAAAAGLYAYFSSDNESPQSHTSNYSQPLSSMSQPSSSRENISSARSSRGVESRNTVPMKSERTTLNQRQGDICSICLISLKQGTLITTNCEHQFHFKCLTKWVQCGNARCPMCNAAIDLDDIGSDD